MIPTFLQQRRSAGHSLRVPIILGGLVLLVAVYSVAIAFVLADRTFTNGSKLGLITFLLVTALVALGFLERIRR